MQSKKLAKPKPGPPTQNYLDIAEIREDTVVLKDGTLRAVLAVSSTNFALKSQEEQQAIIQAYAQFLNGIEYPIQIIVQSRKMNIDPYIKALEGQYKTQTNELLKNQIVDYLAFIKQVVEQGQIMQKRFFVVVPYDPATDKKKNFFSRLAEAVTPAAIIRLQTKQFAKRREALMQRLGIVADALMSMNLRSQLVDTASLIELYYGTYNPDLLESQSIKEIEKIKVEDYGH